MISALAKNYRLHFGTDKSLGRTPDINKKGSTTPRSGGDRPEGGPEGASAHRE
jgi:hypothetical protein